MTLKQRKAIKLVETSSTYKEALLKAGYAPNTALKPSQVTKSKNWTELTEIYLPDEKLLDTHDQLLEDKNPFIVLGALQLGYKIKNKMSEKLINIEKAVITPILGKATADKDEIESSQ